MVLQHEMAPSGQHSLFSNCISKPKSRQQTKQNKYSRNATVHFSGGKICHPRSMQVHFTKLFPGTNYTCES